MLPRWRMMMLPGMTAWPPDFLTPRRRPAESRPLRELPPAFLCAIRDYSSVSCAAGAASASLAAFFAGAFLAAAFGLVPVGLISITLTVVCN